MRPVRTKNLTPARLLRRRRVRFSTIDKEDAPDPRPDRHTKEVQAESVAYTVCQHYGLDTSDYSFGYIAGWSEGKELPELKASLETIRTASHELISDIDRQLADIQKDYARPMEEAAFRLEGEGYLHIQETDNGYDYTIYDQKLHHLDGGLLDEPDLSLLEARKAILEHHFLEPSKIDQIPLQSFEKLRDAAEQAEVPSIQAKLQAAKEKAATMAVMSPDDHLSCETVKTPRGIFHVTDLTKQQMEVAGYGIHHNSDDRRFHIMGNGTRAFAVRNTELPERVTNWRGSQPMSRGKKWRHEWTFFLNATGRRQYHPICCTCSGDCKQSFRVNFLFCPNYHRKPSKNTPD